MKRTLAKEILPVLLLILFVVSCAPREPAPLSDDLKLNSFVREVARSLEEHDWQQILVRADTSHYQTQVVEHGMGEPQYVAELFGLHRVDNNLKRGEVVRWSDLERIESVELQEVTPVDGQHHLTGAVTLEDGSTRELQARIVQVQDRFMLTGALG